MEEIRIKTYFVERDEVPLWLMSDGELVWWGIPSFFLILSFLLVTSWRLG